MMQEVLPVKKMLGMLLAFVMMFCWTAGALAVTVRLPLELDEIPMNILGYPRAPVTPKALADFVSVIVVDGVCQITFDEDPFALDGDEQYADVGVFYTLADDDAEQEAWYLRDEIALEDGMFLFELPEGAELLWASIDLNIKKGVESYYIRKDSNGDSRVQYMVADVRYAYYYEDNMATVGITSEEGTVYFYYDEDGDLIYYAVLVDDEKGYYAYFDLNDTVQLAWYYDTDKEQNVFWEPEIGWYVEAENGEATPLDAPAGFADPTTITLPQ